MSVFSFLFQGMVAFALSYIGVALIRRWAMRRNLLDTPNERSSHVVPTPRGGGLAIAAIVLIGLGISRLLGNAPGSLCFLGYMLGALVIATISGVDDLLGVSARARLFIHLFAAAIFVVLAGSVSRINLPFLSEVDWGWLGVPITLLWIAGLTNTYNFMDGIDGIAAGQAIVAGCFWIFVTTVFAMPALATLSVLVVGASLGFLLHNIRPAKIFMGDVGSTILGYTFAALPVLAFQQTGNSKFLIAGALCVAPFIFDTALTMLRRVLRREDILQAHCTHLYQRLVKMGYSHGLVSLLYVALGSASSLMGVIYIWGDDFVASLALLVVILVLMAHAIGVTWLERQRKALTPKITDSPLGSLANQ